MIRLRFLPERKESTDKNSLNDIYKIFLIVIFYTILTVIFSYPLILEMTTHIQGIGDAWHDLSMFWYTKSAIFGYNPLVNLTYNSYVYYPIGTPNVLEFPFANFLSVPLQLIFGLVAAYNILWMSSFIIAGLGAYLLVKYLTGNDYAAIFSGIAFSFSPYHFAHGLGHMGLLTIEWIPFCALYMIKLYRNFSIKNSFFAAIFFLLTALSDLHYLIYMSIFIGLLIIYDLLIALRSDTNRYSKSSSKAFSEKTMPVIKKYWLFALISAIGILLLSYSMLGIIFSGNDFIKKPIDDTVTYSADLTGFLIPSALHPFYGNWLYSNVYRNFTGNPSENTTFVGYIVLILAVYSFIILRKDKEVRFWGIAAVLFFLLALGPVLHIFGTYKFTSYNLFIPLPFIALYYMPVIGLDRTPDRYSIMVMLCLAVLAGYGMSIIINKLKEVNARRIFFIIATAVLLFEFMSTPFLSLADKPVFYENISHDKENYALLEIPVINNYNAGVKIQYYQVYHNKPIIGGQMAREPINSLSFGKDTPVVNELSYLATMPDILNQSDSAIGNSVFNYYNIGYAIIHTNYLNRSQVGFCMKILNSTAGSTPVFYPDDHLVVYKIEEQKPAPFMVLYDDWYPVTTWQGHPRRLMEDNSTIKIISPDNGTVNLSFDSGSFVQKMNLTVYMNDNQAGIFNVNPIGLENSLPTHISMNITLKKGENTLMFQAPQTFTEHTTVDVSQGSHALGIGFENITLMQ